MRSVAHRPTRPPPRAPLRPASATPTRWNWTWLVSGLLSALVLGAAVLHYPGGSCQRTGESLPPPPGLAAAWLPAAAAAAGTGARGGVAGRRPHLAATPSPAAPSPGAAGSPSAGRAAATHATALYYDPGSAVGSCTLGPFPDTGLYASLPPHRYGKGTLCGSYLDIRGPRGTVRAEVVDLCPGCAADTINLSRAAFDKAVGAGSAQVSYWPLVNPTLPSPIVLRVGATNGGRTTIQVINHGNPLRSVWVAPARAGGSPGASPSAAAGPSASAGASGTPAATWQELRPNTNDFWVARGKLTGGSFAVRVTDYDGHQVLVPHVTLRPGALAHTRVWMYRAGASPSPSAATPSRPPATPAGRGARTPAARRTSAAARGAGC
jgi:expansin (peptidoglycan-binding protein)